METRRASENYSQWENGQELDASESSQSRMEDPGRANYDAPRPKGAVVIPVGVLSLIVGAIAIAVIAGVFIVRYLNDPFRTLEPFPVARYLEGFRSLNGARFKAELHVEADLGWKDSMGRLMLFSAENDPRPVAVMVPADLAKPIYFTKGQTYLAELEVKDGGLIRANRIRKE